MNIFYKGIFDGFIFEIFSISWHVKQKHMQVLIQVISSIFEDFILKINQFI